MTKKNKTPFGIFAESVGLYFSNIKQFIKYMTFPVLGQIAGLVTVFLCTCLYSKNLPYLIENYPVFNNFNTLVLMSVLVALPGLVIFTKAFWEYLVAYGAVNSMLENMLKSGKLYDFSAHTELIKRRSGAFVGLWLLFGLYTVAAVIPFLWVPAAVLLVYFVLTFQVFTFESDLNPIQCVKKSFDLIKGHFLPTFVLMTLAGLLTWLFIPHIINHVFGCMNINNFFANLMLPLTEMLPIGEVNSLFTQFNVQPIQSKDVALIIVTTTVTQIVIQYTLPMRTIMCGLWYMELNGKTPAKDKESKRKKSVKRPSEKLMEESHKKYSVNKKLDRNILRRAMEKDDD